MCGKKVVTLHGKKTFREEMGLIKKNPRNWHVKSGQPLTEMDKRILFFQNKGHLVPTRDLIKTPEQIEGIRKAGMLNTAVLDLVAEKIREGMTTLEIDQLVYDFTTKHGGIPAPLNYEGFPKSCCTSINEVVCHGIPSEEEVLEEGDIINVDCTTILDGYFAAVFSAADGWGHRDRFLVKTPFWSYSRHGCVL